MSRKKDRKGLMNVTYLLFYTKNFLTTFSLSNIDYSLFYRSAKQFAQFNDLSTAWSATVKYATAWYLRIQAQNTDSRKTNLCS